MISGAMGIATSGLMASSKRMENAANNIANIHTTTSRINGETVNTPYRATDVVQTSLQPTGGVQANVVERNPATTLRADDRNVATNGDGTTDYPNVNLEEEVIDTHIASYDFKANLKVIETAEEMMDDLLDIQA